MLTIYKNLRVLAGDNKAVTAIEYLVLAGIVAAALAGLVTFSGIAVGTDGSIGAQ